MDTKDHWENVYSTKESDAVSWFQPHAEQSLELIKASGINKSAAIIDVGSGASTLIDDLLNRNFSQLSVLDLSASALEVAQQRLGQRACEVNWIVGDITQVSLPKNHYDLWHDRAVFHFLTDPIDRQRYIDTVLSALKPGGHIIVATFDEDGPSHCSGLPVQRYNPDELHAEFGTPFQLVGQRKELHETPFGTSQKFIYCYCRRI